MVWTALDFETTGTVKGWPNEPWQLGLVMIEDGVVLPETRWETLLHVGDRPFSPRAVGRYAELREELAAAPEFSELWPEISSRLCGTPSKFLSRTPFVRFLKFRNSRLLRPFYFQISQR